LIDGSGIFGGTVDDVFGSEGHTVERAILPGPVGLGRSGDDLLGIAADPRPNLRLGVLIQLGLARASSWLAWLEAMILRFRWLRVG
jgi:hypothetical protein